MGLLLFRPLAGRLGLLSVLFAGVGAAAAVVPADVVMTNIPGVRGFPEATEPQVVRFACADGPSPLFAFFKKSGLRFDSSLLRPLVGYEACHIHYEPTAPGFRASPEDRPVKTLYGMLDPMSFLVDRKPTGDSLDVFKQILAGLPPDVDMVFTVPGGFPSEELRRSASRHLSGFSSRFRLRRSESTDFHPWMQDQMKAGEVDGRLRVLSPRRLFEGRSDDGERFKPLIDELWEEGFSRSKLSWDGGDLLFVLDPKDRSQTILIHGGAAQSYWGAGLTDDEYSWVLRTEFGADRALNLSSIGPHVDLLVAFLPADGIALVSDPVRENAGILREAVKRLAVIYGANAPPALAELASFVESWDGDLAAHEKSLRRAIDALRGRLPLIEWTPDPAFARELDAFVATHCPDKPDDCFSGPGKWNMFREDPDLLRRLADGAVNTDDGNLLAPKLLGLIEGQLPSAGRWEKKRLDAAAKTLARMGFRVVRAPHLIAPSLADVWPGVSYVNMLAVGRTLFAPTFGLGQSEENLLRELERQIGGEYHVVGAPASFTVTINGGVHCVVGIVRETGAP